MSATEAQINYINNLKSGIENEMSKGFRENLYNSHFGDWMRSTVRQLKRETGRDRLELNAEVIAEFYPQWVEQVRDRLNFDPEQLSISDASAKIDELKRPSTILRVEL